MCDFAENSSDRQQDRESKTNMQFSLKHGRTLLVSGDDDSDTLTVSERGGTISLSIKMTADGPVVSVTGASLDLKGTKNISLEAENVEIKSRDNMNITSGNDLRVNGKMVYIN